MNFLKNDPRGRIRLCRAGAWLLPALIMTVGMIGCGIAPFGESSLLAMDGWGQYFPMLRHAEKAFFTGERYSLSGALGFDSIAQGAYYTNSPLWWLLFFLPGKITPAGVDLIVLLRFALAGWSFSVYLTGRKQREYTTAELCGIVAISTAYACSGYTLAFINQLMWMDAVWLLPLIVLGLERLYDGAYGVLYLGALALTIYSNFYIAFMVCLFCVLWFLGLLFCRSGTWRCKYEATARFTLMSLLAGALNLPILLPAARALGQTIASELTFDRALAWHKDFSHIWRRLLPFGEYSLEYGLPNLYCGAICVLLLLPALLCRRTTWRTKIAVGLLLIFFVVSFGLNALDFLWHGFHFPNQLPGRQSFLFIFTLLTAAYVGLRTLTVRIPRWGGMLLAVCIAAEITANAWVTMGCSLRHFSAYWVAPLDEQIEAVRDTLTPDAKAGEFWRVELISPRDNGGQLYDYTGISYYSSTMSGDAYQFFTQLGLPIYAKNVSVRYESCPILDTLFGVRYLIGDTTEYDPRYQHIVSHDKANSSSNGVIENRTALPLAYLARPAVLKVDMSLRGHALRNDLFCRAAGCRDVIDADGYWDIEALLEGAARLHEGAMDIESIQNGQIVGTLNAARDGVLMMSLPAADIRVFVDGKEAEVLAICGYMGGVSVKCGSHEVKIMFK